MPEQPIKYSPEFRPPQFNREDYELWVKWKDELERRYERVEYSVVLGGETGPPGTEQTYSEMWKRITARRVDAVGYAKDHIALIEFRKFAGPSAIGQLQMYKALWERERGTYKPIRLVLISDLLTDAIITTAKALEIETIIVK